MAYVVNLTNGNVLATVADGTIDTSATDLKLIGKNYTGYGEILNENYVWMLENFADINAPTAPISGQLWWNTAANVLNVYDGTQFKSVSSSTVSATEPPGSVVGDLWWNSANEQLFVYNGASWILIGPAFTSGAGQSGAVVEVITDTSQFDHVVVMTYAADTVISIASKDPVFTPNVGIPGFSEVRPGVNLANAGTIPGIRYTGAATNSDALEGITATQFMRSDIDTSTVGVLDVDNDGGIKIGVSNDLTLSVTGGTTTEIFNRISGANMSIGTTTAGGQARAAFSINGTSGEISVGSVKITDLADPTAAQDAVTKLYVDTQLGGGATTVLFSDASVAIQGNLIPDSTGTRDFGSAAANFATIYATTFSGTATEANYADVAERFETDGAYAPGTIVELGGLNEITKANTELSDDVFGVISTNPAHLMNASAGTNETHPPVAMTGRVPVRVVGIVSKGDRLVSAGNGIARAASKNELTSFNVIGRSLDNKPTTGEGVVEAIVNMQS